VEIRADVNPPYRRRAPIAILPRQINAPLLAQPIEARSVAATSTTAAPRTIAQRKEAIVRHSADPTAQRLRTLTERSLTQGSFAPRSLGLLESSKSFQRLSAADQGKVLDLYTRSSSLGQHAIETMAQNGRLFSSDTPPAGVAPARTLDHLHDIATGPIAKGIDRNALLSSTIQEANNPGHILQGRRGTCTVTSLNYSLADRSPAEHARLVAGLASPEGKVRMANGDLLERKAGTESDDGSGRTPSARLLQPALMEYGNGSLEYDNRRDVNLKNGKLDHTGLFPPETERVAKALFDRPFKVYSRIAPDKDYAFPIGSSAGFNVGNGPHEITPLAVHGGRLYFRDPNGEAGLRIGSSQKLFGPDSPPYRAEYGRGHDGQTVDGEFSIPAAEFNRRVQMILVPQ
jgi:hypothetical protein